MHNGVMADSSALRSRRSRAHAAGDHSLCRRSAACASLVPAGPVRDAAPCADTAGALARLAGRLEAAHVADPGNALVARELRACLLALPAPGDGEDDPLEELSDLAGVVP